MPDLKVDEPKKAVEKKKYLWIVNILKKSIGATTIIKCILDLGVNMAIGELLALAPGIKKQLTKAITKDEIIQFQVNILKSNIVDVQKTPSWYSMGSSKAKIKLEDSSKIIALLDIGIKINVMTREVMEIVGLAMQCGLKLELIAYIGYSHLFLGLYKNVEVAIGRLKKKPLIFVVEHGDHDLVLS